MTDAMTTTPPAVSPASRATDLAKQRASLEQQLPAASSQATAGDDAYAKSLAEHETALKGIDSDIDKIVKDRPTPPTLEKAPEAPKEIKTDPTRVLGQFLPVMAIFAGLRTRSPATAAMKAGAAAMTAARQNDKDAFEEAHKTFMDKMEETKLTWEMQRDQYLDILNDTKMSMEQKMAELNVQAAINGDENAKHMIANGQLDKLYQQLQMVDTAQYHLDTVMNETKRIGLEGQRNQIEMLRAKNEQAYREADLKIKATQAGKMNLSQLASQLEQERAQAMAQDPKGGLWPAYREKQLQDVISMVERQGVVGGDNSNPEGGGGSGLTKESPVPMPEVKGDLQANSWYLTPQGVKKWTGTGFADK